MGRIWATWINTGAKFGGSEYRQIARMLQGLYWPPAGGF